MGRKSRRNRTTIKNNKRCQRRLIKEQKKMQKQQILTSATVKMKFVKGSRSGSREVKDQLIIIQEKKCFKCGLINDHLQLHHLRPIRLGGETTVYNGFLLCDKCHSLYHKKFDDILNEIASKHPETDFRLLFLKQCKSDKNWVEL